MNCCGWRSWIRMTVTSAPPPPSTPESNFQKVKWSRQGYKEQSLFPPWCCYSIHQNLILTWSSRTFRPDCSLLTINHQNGPFIKRPPWSGPLVTHKCFSNIKSDIDGAPRPAAAEVCPISTVTKVVINIIMFPRMKDSRAGGLSWGSA